ncbi:hypothetical protein ACO2J1_04555 [Leptospira interrogans]|uniref:Uncharacterized protein n=2 Tax=Leptospira interrogans TaxID=173 RepID=A0AAV9FQN5_LEPIR|nr:hypothetical protein [Leptospira interrogans]ASV05814.1 hypothetical protein B2G47_07015 [Leptospira interrogans serovar Canicola]ASV08414.1 hypothetical protein B2G50_03675 [Leptospira interrogans serovar Canicola]EKO70129.1 hypothetical protein LEP1GSC069_2538 [Leptospira interrogans serovar Canicola str. Fiocruz LV133]EKR24934.1 hypothetical protein LEP1GSC087_1373 [Leptospira interrogans serovar Bataviae str. L1111]EKR45677.1 hypothetical protein LEP1GSC097_2120 [Leptospira interrogans 
MSALSEVALQIASEIRKVNLREDQRIPTSDTFIKELMSLFSREPDELRNILETLRTAKIIFIIKIVLPDDKTSRMNDPGVDAYAYADLKILNDLKYYSEKKLERLYEATYYKKKSPSTITRELFPKIRELNNTPMGRMVNIAVMLEEYIRMMNNNPNEFQEEFRTQAIEDLLLSTGDTSKTSDRQTPLSNSFGPNLSQRATDRMEIPTNINPNSPWGRMVSKFSIDFLLRVHLRKCEFETIRKLITSGKVTSEENLRLIRDSLLKMEKNVNVDKVLASYLDEMTELRRLTQRKLNSIAKPKTL